jgi:glycosyltransferase involved in cell wall biosynthesis
MAAGRPILAIIGEKSEVARVAKEYNCGIVVPHGNAQGIAKALIKLQKDKNLCAVMGENARRAFEDNFTKRHAINNYYEVIKNLFLERKALPKEKKTKVGPIYIH